MVSQQHANFNAESANDASDRNLDSRNELLQPAGDVVEEKAASDVQRQVWDDSSFLEVLEKRQKEFQDLERKHVGHVVSESEMISIRFDETNPTDTPAAPSHVRDINFMYNCLFSLCFILFLLILLSALPLLRTRIHAHLDHFQSEINPSTAVERPDQLRTRHKVEGNFIYFNNGGPEMEGKNVGRLHEIRTKRSMEIKSAGRQMTPRPLDREWLQNHSLKSHVSNDP